MSPTIAIFQPKTCASIAASAVINDMPAQTQTVMKVAKTGRATPSYPRSLGKTLSLPIHGASKTGIAKKARHIAIRKKTSRSLSLLPSETITAKAIADPPRVARSKSASS